MLLCIGKKYFLLDITFYKIFILCFLLTPVSSNEGKHIGEIPPVSALLDGPDGQLVLAQGDLQLVLPGAATVDGATGANGQTDTGRRDQEGLRSKECMNINQGCLGPYPPVITLKREAMMLVCRLFLIRNLGACRRDLPQTITRALLEDVSRRHCAFIDPQERKSA